MSYKYGEIFEKLGIPGMGHQGATWCALDPQSVLVLMAHQNFVHKRRGVWQYEVPDQGVQPRRSHSATRSLDMIDSYFVPGIGILLPVAVFLTDGGPRADGTWESSEFKAATGAVYRATMVHFDRSTGHLLCDISGKFSV